MLRRKTNFFSTEECLEFYNICIRDTSFPSHPEIHPPHAELRFAVGDEVSCNCSPWQTGRVLNSPYFEMGQEFPYQVMIGLEKVVKVPFDGDGVITSHFVTPASARVRLIQTEHEIFERKMRKQRKIEQENRAVHGHFGGRPTNRYQTRKHGNHFDQCHQRGHPWGHPWQKQIQKKER